MENNPIRFIDPDGMQATDDYYFKVDGQLDYVVQTDKEDKFIQADKDGNNKEIASSELTSGMQDDYQTIKAGLGNGDLTFDSGVYSINDKQNSTTDKSGLYLSFLGYGMGKGESKLFNKSTWYSLESMRSYSRGFHGNQYVRGSGLSKKIGKGLKWGGYALAAYGFYSVYNDYETGEPQYNGRPLTKTWRNVEYGANTLSLLPVAGPGIGIGWEMGRNIAGNPWYRENMRPYLQDALGVERDEY